MVPDVANEALTKRAKSLLDGGVQSTPSYFKHERIDHVKPDNIIFYLRNRRSTTKGFPLRLQGLPLLGYALHRSRIQKAYTFSTHVC